jgi:hypothetical protein
MSEHRRGRHAAPARIDASLVAELRDIVRFAALHRSRRHFAPDVGRAVAARGPLDGFARRAGNRGVLSFREEVHRRASGRARRHDTLLFTGGIEQHAAPVHADVACGLEHLGVADFPRNEASAAVVSPDGARVVLRVFAADEEFMIAPHTARAIEARPA